MLYQNILAGRIEFPRHVSKTARDLISKLLQADLSRRLGNLRGGSADIRKHPFFKVSHGVSFLARGCALNSCIAGFRLEPSHDAQASCAH